MENGETRPQTWLTNKEARSQQYMVEQIHPHPSRSFLRPCSKTFEGKKVQPKSDKYDTSFALLAFGPCISLPTPPSTPGAGNALNCGEGHLQEASGVQGRPTGGFHRAMDQLLCLGLPRLDPHAARRERGARLLSSLLFRSSPTIRWDNQRFDWTCKHKTYLAGQMLMSKRTLSHSQNRCLSDSTQNRVKTQGA